MYNNINYYNQITSPLHNHKSYKDQVSLLGDIRKNMTALSMDFDSSTTYLQTFEEKIHADAKTYFDKNDKNLDLDTQ